MATFREIDDRLLALTDPETGEILDVQAFEQLQMERTQKAENMALWALDLDDEVQAIDGELTRLMARKRAAQAKAKSLRQYLGIILDGEKLKTPLVSVSYRRTPAVEVEDEHALIEWAQRSTEHGDTALRYREPEISKAGVRQLIEEGVAVPGAQIVTHVSTIIK